MPKHATELRLMQQGFVACDELLQGNQVKE